MKSPLSSPAIEQQRKGRKSPVNPTLNFHVWLEIKWPLISPHNRILFFSLPSLRNKMSEIKTQQFKHLSSAHISISSAYRQHIIMKTFFSFDTDCFFLTCYCRSLSALVVLHPPASASLSRTLLSLRVLCCPEQMQSQEPLAASLNTAISFNNSSSANVNELFLCWPHGGEYRALLLHHVGEKMQLLQPIYVCVLKLKIGARRFL